MFTSFSTALSALNAASAAVNIVGNNLANLNTTGYKAQTAQFADLMSQALGVGSAETEIGLGVAPTLAVRQFAQGAVQQTAGAFDAAIQGKGFFVVRDQNGETLFTRAGNFALDSDGHLRTATGSAVQGWNLVDGAVNPNMPVEDIVVPAGGSAPPAATRALSLALNLNAGGVTGESTGAYATPVQVVDALGGVHTLSVTFTKTGANAWSYAVTIPPADLASGGNATLASGALAFDGKGQLTSPAAASAPIAINVSGLANGAADLAIQWSLFRDGKGLISQFAQASSVAAVNQDGVKAGEISSVGLADGGLIVARYSNGQQVTVGQLALAAIANPETMEAVGNNNLRPTPKTAIAAIGVAESGGRGQIVGGALESSTVDIATEFTNLISYQRTYQANSRMITTTDQMTQDLISLIR